MPENFDALFDKPPRAAPLPPHQVAPANGNPAYVKAARDAELATLAATTVSRNDALNVAAFSLFGLVAGGHLDLDPTWDALQDSAIRIGLTPTEVDATLRSAYTAAEPRTVPLPAVVPTLTVLSTTGEAEFWAARPVLAHLHDFARSRRAAPWAVLGVALARVVVATPPMVMLPPLVGSEASLNLFVAIVGASGSGKGAATGAAKAGLQLDRHLTSFPVGSGEGLTHLFVKATKDGIEQHTHAVIAEVAEVDTLTALQARQGSTLQSLLRQAYMGEQYGFGYADPTKRLVVGAHAYRLALVVGVQPKRAAGLLDDVDGGTPQRYLWMPADDPRAPDVRPESPAPWVWKAPALPEKDDVGHRLLPVCATAKDAIDAGRLSRVRGQQTALDGHALLAREKVAAALGLLDGRAEISEEDWELAGIVMAVSDRTRANIEAELKTVKRATNEARGSADGDRAVIVTDRLEASAAKKMATSVLRRIRSSDAGMTGAKILSSVTRGQRHLLDGVLDGLLDAGSITVEDTAVHASGGGGPGRRYRASSSADS